MGVRFAGEEPATPAPPGVAYADVEPVQKHDVPQQNGSVKFVDTPMLTLEERMDVQEQLLKQMFSVLCELRDRSPTKAVVAEQACESAASTRFRKLRKHCQSLVISESEMGVAAQHPDQRRKSCAAALKKRKSCCAAGLQKSRRSCVASLHKSGKSCCAAAADAPKTRMAVAGGGVEASVATMLNPDMFHVNRLPMGIMHPEGRLRSAWDLSMVMLLGYVATSVPFAPWLAAEPPASTLRLKCRATHSDVPPDRGMPSFRCRWSFLSSASSSWRTSPLTYSRTCSSSPTSASTSTQPSWIRVTGSSPRGARLRTDTCGLGSSLTWSPPSQCRSSSLLIHPLRRSSSSSSSDSSKCFASHGSRGSVPCASSSRTAHFTHLW